jgi:hypothetical protein
MEQIEIERIIKEEREKKIKNDTERIIKRETDRIIKEEKERIIKEETEKIIKEETERIIEEDKERIIKKEKNKIYEKQKEEKERIFVSTKTRICWRIKQIIVDDSSFYKKYDDLYHKPYAKYYEYISKKILSECHEFTCKRYVNTSECFITIVLPSFSEDHIFEKCIDHYNNNKTYYKKHLFKYIELCKKGLTDDLECIDWD